MPESKAVAGATLDQTVPGAVDLDDEIAFDKAMRALLHPRRIAIVGATPKKGFANSIHRRLLAGGYDGEIIPINPNYPEVMGLQAYPTIADVPGGADLAIVVVPSRLVPGVLEDCERGGVGAVNIITSGFAEKQEDETGAERQRAIRQFAERTGIRVVGPNCHGNLPVPNKTLAGPRPYSPLRDGPISLALQSGLLAYSLVLPPNDRGFGFRYIVTLGNEADVDVVDMIRYYVRDEGTRVIGCFVEQFRRPADFLRVAAEAAERGKPIVMLKVGRSEAGRKSALAHTGSLVGSDVVIDAVFSQSGVIRVSCLEEMIETLAVFHSHKLPKGNGVGTAVVSGGAAGVLADVGNDVGIRYPTLAPDTVEKMNKVIPPYGTVGNPLDYTGQAAQQPEILGGCLSAMAEDPEIDTIIYGQAYPGLIDLGTPSGQVLKELPQRYPDKVFLVLSLVTGDLRDRMPDMPAEEPVSELDGIPFLQGAEHGLRAVASLIRYAEFQRQRQGVRGVNEHDAGTEDGVIERAREMLAASGGRPLVERDAKALLALYGIPVTQEKLATTADEAVAAAREIGYPVVLKVESADISHKTDAGGVLLNVEGDEAVRAGFDRIVENAHAYNQNAVVAGVLVQEMVRSDGGQHELILGMTQDPSFGPAIAVGLGGIFVETLKDVQLGVPPLAEKDARLMLSRLRAAPLLDGSGSRG